MPSFVAHVRIRNRIIEMLEWMMESEQRPPAIGLDELINLWSDWVNSPLRGDEFAAPVYTADENDHLRRVSAAVDAFCNVTPQTIKDDAEALALPEWATVVQAARDALDQLMIRGRLREPEDMDADTASRLANVLRGATVLSMKIAGPVLELCFCGVELSHSRIASIVTDAWIFVGNKDDFCPDQVADAEFFPKRPNAIVGLYELTGHDVETVHVSDVGTLTLRIGEKDVIIYPIFVESYLSQDFWVIIIDNGNKRTDIVGFDAGIGLYISNTCREPPTAPEVV